MKLFFVVADNQSDNKADNRINQGKDKFQSHNIRQMLIQEEIMLGNIPVIITCNSEVEDYVEDHREIEKREIKPETMVAHKILDSSVNSKNIKRFN